ncbi:hypothetical protein Tco_1109592 [Tanacetum coccineum]
MQSPFLQSPPKGSSQTEGKHMKKDKGKKALSLEEAVKESTESDSDDDETHLSGSMVESSRIKKKIEEEAKAEAAKRESETKKGPITLKVYRKDGISEVISNFKASDMHLGEWREVVKACPNRTGKGWQTIDGQIKKWTTCTQLKQN